MHVVDDVHCFVVYASNLGEHLLVVGHYLLELELVAGEHGDTLYHYGTGVLATTTVDSEQESLGEVSTCTEELDLLTDSLV